MTFVMLLDMKKETIFVKFHDFLNFFLSGVRTYFVNN